ncbi:MAG: RsmB/NOP family class I SAM-dependent RNA methyltransferase [Aquamicrobium sp.]|uniref:RsmB/NOP family class I SAM-dependent RNA methyltransferase n=1 Tax=Aquamicrobium sp. TaxID=1872579 RepID=UPI00349E4C15|nr:RsmB/NOP family class I SAM-dependent RNA methyltransferase [Aquamicrobium sp.]
MTAKTISAAARLVTPGLAARKAAARLLAAVVDAKTPLDGLTDHDHGHPQFRALEPRDRALVRAILTTALRFRRTIEALIGARLERPLPANAHALSHILHVAAAQILLLDVPDSAAVDLAVTHAKDDPRTARFSALVNGVLREIARRKERALPAALARTVDAPDWFAQSLNAAYGEALAGDILAAHRLEPAIDLTVKSDAAGWAERLGGIVLPTGSVRLERLPAPLTELPGFAEGKWWVQDAAAALPARLLGGIAGLRVADLCAAPGGKTAQLASAGASVTALEISPNRIKRLRANLDRLKLDAEIVQGDLFAFAPDAPFDAVLLDAPCSSTGTVRRHPDVPWTKSVEDVEKLTGLQARMLAHAATLLRPGGRLVFSNCSLERGEGEALLSAFLADNPQIVADPVRPGEFPFLDPFLTGHGWVRTTPAGLKLATPALSGLDGFFAARLRRRD